MKTTRTKNLTVLVLFLFIGMGMQAQFFKKLKKRAEEAAKETVLRKAEEKAANETSKAMDKVFDMDFGKKPSKVDPAILQGSYDYSWRYTLKMDHKKGAMKINYFLREEGTDFGSSFEMDQGTDLVQGMFMIMDEAAGITTILMERNGKKFGQVISSPTDDIMDMQEQQNTLDGYEFKEVGTKEILGYECQGFQIDNEDLTMTMYVAFDTPVSLNQVYGPQMKKRLPKGFDPKWLDKMGDNSLMMEMNVVNKKKSKQNIKMTCIALEEEPTSIHMAEYEFPQFQMQEQTEEDY